MRVLFFIPTLNGGGAEKVLSDLVKMLQVDKYEITVKTLFSEGIYIKSIKERCKYEYCFNTDKKFLYWLYHSFINHSHWFPRKMLWNLFIREKFDVEIAFMEGVCTRIISGSSNKESTKIAWLHTDLESNSESLKQFQSMEESLISYKTFDHIITVSSQSKNSFEGLYGIEITIIPNPIDKEILINKSFEEVYCIRQRGIPTLIAIGRLEPIKGFDRLLDIHKRLIHEGYYHNLVILGEGSLFQEYQTFIKNHELTDSVRLLGFQSNPYKYLIQADVLVSSSLAEGFSLVIAEALVLGIPVLATQTAGSLDILGVENVIPNSEQAIYENIKMILTDSKRLQSMKTWAVDYAEKYDSKHIIKQIEQLLD